MSITSKHYRQRLALTLLCLVLPAGLLFGQWGKTRSHVQDSIVGVALKSERAQPAARPIAPPQPSLARHHAAAMSVAPTAPAQSGGSFNLTQSVVSGGGGASANGNTNVTGAISQSVASASSNGQFAISGGFWSGSVGGGCPAITVNPATLPNGQVGQPYSQQLTQTGGGGAIIWSVRAGSLPNNLTLNPTTGLLSGAPTGFGLFTFMARATDASGCFGERQYTLRICPTITVNPASLPGGAPGAAYNQAITATGGTAPYSFAVTSGALPSGLTLSASGAINGTPAAAGTFNFTALATDANNCIGARAYSITINSPCAAITIAPATLPNGSVGAVYDQMVTAGGGTAPYIFSVSAGALPPGLSLNSTTGAISGAPAQAGRFDFMINATGAGGCMGGRAYTVRILAHTVTTVSAASYAPALAPKAIVAGYGVSLANSTAIASSLPLPTELAGTKVMVRDVIGIERAAPLFFVSPMQINYQIPGDTAPGAATVTVFIGDEAVAAGAARIMATAPAILTLNQSGSGPAMAVDAFTGEAAPFNATQANGQPNIIAVFGTGLGADVTDADGNANTSTQALMDGNPITTLYAGRAPGFVGLNQFNLALPAGIASGAHTLTIGRGGSTSNMVIITIR